MPKFRKKPVVIEAVQWNGGSPLPEGCSYGNGEHFDLTVCYISTLEGTMRADVGDWIITGVKGEKYPCKNDIFEMTYEPIEGGEESVMNELENCPFCGEPNPNIWLRDDGWCVKCVNGCSVSLSGYISRTGAVRAWNCRPRPGDDGDDPQVAYIEGLHVDLERLQAEVEQLQILADDAQREVRCLREAIENRWIPWDIKNPPHGSEIGFVAFLNVVNRTRWIQTDACVSGDFWYDSVPTHWMPRNSWPLLPREEG